MQDNKLGERIKTKAIEYGGVSKLARDLGIGRKTLENYTNNVNDPQINTLMTISKLTDTDFVWFITGKNNNANSITTPIVSQAVQYVMEYLLEHEEQLVPAAIGQVCAVVCDLSKSNGEVSKDTIENLMKLRMT